MLQALLAAYAACDPSSETCEQPSSSADGTCADGSTCRAAPAADDPAHTACENTNPDCERWAGVGECDANPGFMIVECAKSCRTCHLRDPKVRCVRDPTEVPALRGAAAGDGIAAAMEWATSDTWAAYSPTVLSRDPWVVQFEDFLSADEVQALLEAGSGKAYERSSNVGGMNEMGRFKKSLDNTRTSENAWCDGACADHPAARLISQRIGNLTRVKEANSEVLALPPPAARMSRAVTSPALCGAVPAAVEVRGGPVLQAAPRLHPVASTVPLWAAPLHDVPVPVRGGGGRRDCLHPPRHRSQAQAGPGAAVALCARRGPSQVRHAHHARGEARHQGRQVCGQRVAAPL